MVVCITGSFYEPANSCETLSGTYFSWLWINPRSHTHIFIEELMLFRTPALGGPVLPWAMEASQENVGLGCILCFLCQSIHHETHAGVPLTAPRSLPAQKQSCQQCLIFLRAFACRVASRGALSWRTKLCHCRGLQTSRWLQSTIKRHRAGPYRLAHHDLRCSKGQTKWAQWEVGSLSPGSSLRAGSCLLGKAHRYI